MLRPALLLVLLLASPAWAQSSVYVANQGNFSDGDGSVTAFPLFEDAGGPTQLFDGSLGSILQSATLIGSDLYLVANSANRITVVDTEADRIVGQAGGGAASPFSSPRYLADLGSRALVTNHVYGGTSYVLPLDLDDLTTGTPIEVAGLPETMAVVDGRKVYVALGAFGPGAGGVDSLAVLDAGADPVTVDYLDIDCYARFVMMTQSFEVLAFCTDTDEMVVVDPDADAVVQRLAFGEEIGDPSDVGQTVGIAGIALPVRRAAPPPASSFLVIVASGLVEVGDSRDGWEIVRRIPISDTDTRPISAVAVPVGTGRIVLGRPDPDAPFSADGVVTVHDYDGSLVATYPAGVYPTHVAVQERIPTATAGAPGGAAVGLVLAGPNPARARTALAVTLDRPARATVTLYDVLGRPALTLGGGALAAGTHTLGVDVSALPAGLYLARVVTEGGAADVAVTVAR